MEKKIKPAFPLEKQMTQLLAAIMSVFAGTEYYARLSAKAKGDRMTYVIIRRVNP